MAKKTKAEALQELLIEEEMKNVRARLAMAQLICELRDANDPDLEMKEAFIRQAMKRLAVHNLERFDDELNKIEMSRKVAK